MTAVHSRGLFLPAIALASCLISRGGVSLSAPADPADRDGLRGAEPRFLQQARRYSSPAGQGHAVVVWPTVRVTPALPAAQAAADADRAAGRLSEAERARLERRIQDLEAAVRPPCPPPCPPAKSLPCHRVGPH